MQNEFKCAQYFIIDSRIMRDKNLSTCDIVLYSLLCGLSNNYKNCCYATNSYLAEFLNVSPRSIQNSLFRLKKYGYIVINIKNHNQRKIKTMFNLAIDFREKKLKELEKRGKKDLLDYDWLNDEGDFYEMTKKDYLEEV